MEIEVRPATSFADVRTMVGPKRPDANVCWCLSYRLTSSKENLSLTGPARGERVRELCALEPPPGVLAYAGDEVVGWASVHPRADTSFATNRKIPHVDDADVQETHAAVGEARGITSNTVGSALERLHRKRLLAAFVDIVAASDDRALDELERLVRAKRRGGKP